MEPVQLGAQPINLPFQPIRPRLCPFDPGQPLGRQIAEGRNLPRVQG
jgi:hypothetical protein